MNYLVFLAAFFSFASAVYKVKEDTKYNFKYTATLLPKTGKVCTGKGKVTIEINGLKIYGEELTSNNEISQTLAWYSPKGNFEADITHYFRFQLEGSDNWSTTSDNCWVSYKNQDLFQDISELTKLFPSTCKAYRENPLTLPYLEDRLKRCTGICGATIALGTFVINPGAAILLAPTYAAAGCIGGCIGLVCREGLVGAECAKATRECSPNGLRCCGNSTCKKLPNGRGKYKCR